MEMNISRVLSLLLSKIQYIILVSLIFAVATLAYTKLCVPEKYTSTAKFLVIMDEDNSKSTEANFVKEAIHSYLEIFNTTKFFNEVAESFNAQSDMRVYTASELKSITKVQSSSNADAPAFSIRVTSSDPNLCFKLANTVASNMIKKSTEYKALNKIELIDDPIKPVAPSSPNVVKNTISGFLAGAIIVCACFIFFDAMDKKVKNLEDITKNFSIPVLGVVPDTSPDTVGKYNKKLVKEKKQNG